MAFKGKITAKVIVLAVLLLVTARLDAVQITDDVGQRLDFPAPPARVVSLLPSVTEIICFIGASESLAGVTYQDTHFEGVAGVPVVGGALSPQFEAITALSPDLLIVASSDFERAKAGLGETAYPILVLADNVNLAVGEARARSIGEIFGRAGETESLIRENHETMETIRLKTDKIPKERRQKVAYLTLDAGGLATPGRDSFQTEIIKAAGGIAGNFGDSGFVSVTFEKLSQFAPDFIYTTDTEHADIKKLLDQDGWRDIPAVKNERLRAFPGALTDRAAAHVGYFTAWLSAEIYSDEFADVSKLVHPQEIISERAVSLDIPYVERARVIDSRIIDFVHRTLLIDFKRPQHIVSTVGGERAGVEIIGNSYSPTPTWSVYHKLGFERSRSDLFDVLKLDKDKADIMFTGADMNNAVIKSVSYRDMTAVAVVTAGVEGNALRTSKDTGEWYEPGTINILVMTNHKLSEQAATRAIVTITEAKTAALWDMDIRSVQTPLVNPATGTGTDTVIVVSGEGVALNWSGGHSKMGELIADAVYRGVQEALLKQNGKAPRRSVFERLRERGIFFSSASGFSNREMEELLLSPVYSGCQGFVESALSLSDAYVMGQIKDISSFEAWALRVAGDIAGRPVERIENITGRGDIPVVLKTALDALATGLKYRDKAAGGVQTRKGA